MNIYTRGNYVTREVSARGRIVLSADLFRVLRSVRGPTVGEIVVVIKTRRFRM